jgi:PAS domain S-box-containing protein
MNEATGPMQFGPGNGRPVPAGTSQRFGFHSFIAMVLRPKSGKPWEFGLHQCSQPRVWTVDEEQLFEAVGRRLTDGLSTVLAYRGLEASEKKYRTLFEESFDGLFITTPAGKVVDANRKCIELFGYDSREQIHDIDMARDIYADPAERARVTALIESEGAADFELAVKKRNGERMVAQCTVTAERDRDGVVTCYRGTVRDITARRMAEEALRIGESHLRRVNRALRTLSAGNEAVVRAVSEPELLERMCRVMVEVGGHALAWIGCPGPDGTIVPKAWAGPEDDSLQGCAGVGVCGPITAAVEGGRALVAHDIVAHPAWAACRERLLGCGLRSSLILPLKSEGEHLGALSIYSTDPAAFDDDEVALLTELGHDLAYGIRALRIRLSREEGLRRIQSTMEATIQALAATVELRDPYTAGHERRVAQLAVAIGLELGLAGDRINGLYLAAVVHDIGKIYVPAEILSKPGRLTRIEFDLVKTHVDAGYDILKSIDFPWPIAEIVRQHHERLDGSGYPRGLKRQGLLLESRILAVADVVEAITSFRPYRPALGIDVALREIEAGRGVLFDGDAVDACGRLIRDRNFGFD